MAKCKGCGSSNIKKEVLGEFQDDLMGIPVVVVDAVTQEVCGECGKVREHLIPNIEGLVAAIAVTRALLPHKLNGVEIKFLRKALGWKAKDLADRLGVTPETLSRWENDVTVMQEATERLLRLVVYTVLGDTAPRVKETRTANDIVYMAISSVRDVESIRPLCFSLYREASEPVIPYEERRVA